jgi:pyruvate,water dikinase
MLASALGTERTKAALSELVMGVCPDTEADVPRAMRELTTGNLDKTEFLKRCGHRGPREMELAEPRWSESCEVQTVAQVNEPVANAPGPEGARERVLSEQKLAQKRPALEVELDALLDLLALRETAKHYLLMGYAQIRRVLCELDRRYGLNGGIFFLTREELPRLIQGEDLSIVIAARRRRHELALSLEVPPVLFSDDLEAIGRQVETAAAQTLQGVALSAGTAEGVALVLQTPDATAIPHEPYILVCPSTDPAWLPLFIRAKGLVMETGGVLSHGAIVAREFGLPAVAGLPDVQRRIRNGQRLKIDGGAGIVTLLFEI